LTYCPLSLTDAKKQYEIEKQKSEQSIKDVVQQYVATIETITQQHASWSNSSEFSRQAVNLLNTR